MEINSLKNPIEIFATQANYCQTNSVLGGFNVSRVLYINRKWSKKNVHTVLLKCIEFGSDSALWIY